MHILISIFATAATMLALPHVVPGVSVDSWFTAIVVAILFGVLSVTVKPIIYILTLPLSLLTFGLFSFVINAGLMLLLASFVEGFAIASFFSALLVGALVAVVQSVVHRVF